MSIFHFTFYDLVNWYTVYVHCSTYYVCLCVEHCGNYSWGWHRDTALWESILLLLLFLLLLHVFPYNGNQLCIHVFALHGSVKLYTLSLYHFNLFQNIISTTVCRLHNDDSWRVCLFLHFNQQRINETWTTSCVLYWKREEKGKISSKCCSFVNYLHTISK